MTTPKHQPTPQALPLAALGLSAPREDALARAQARHARGPEISVADALATLRRMQAGELRR